MSIYNVRLNKLIKNIFSFYAFYMLIKKKYAFKLHLICREIHIAI